MIAPTPAFTRSLIRQLVGLVAADVPDAQWPIDESDLRAALEAFLHGFIPLHMAEIVREARALKTHDVHGVPFVVGADNAVGSNEGKA